MDVGGRIALPFPWEARLVVPGSKVAGLSVCCGEKSTREFCLFAEERSRELEASAML